MVTRRWGADDGQVNRGAAASAGGPDADAAVASQVDGEAGTLV